MILEPMKATFVDGSRGGRCLLFSDCLYQQPYKATRYGNRSWYCHMYRKTQCQSVLITNAADIIIKIKGYHNHSLDQVVENVNFYRHN